MCAAQTIEFHQVNKRYESGHQALSNLSFQMHAKEMAFLTGHSGAGKSTLLKLIALIERATTGSVVIDGQNLNAMGRRHIPFLRRSIGLIFQDHQLLHDRSVFDNIALPLIIAGMPPAKISPLVLAALEKVGLEGRDKVRPIMLSGGEQQRVGIARALVGRPKVLLADEPTGNLDPELSREIMQLFVDYHLEGNTVLIATHDLDLVANMGKRVLTLEGGNLVQDIPAVGEVTPIEEDSIHTLGEGHE
ncbi:MAG: cell division ATP-binding protein FtsE [Gammaproteobacteria bacterium]|nr:cell division ATP-binding protein FtsE [Gammaproteobacteria bacterium]